MRTKIIAICLAVCTLLLVSCRDIGELTESGFIDPNTGIEYVQVTPMGLYPLEPESEFISVKEGETETMYYKVWFEDTAKFLCYETEGYYFLVRSTEVSEPTVTEFEPIAAFIYNPANTVLVDRMYANEEYIPEEQRKDSTIGETELCQLIASSIIEGEAVSVAVTRDDVKNHFSIRLLSQKYPGLYYLVTFFEYNGRYFLRDDAMGKTVYCPYDVIVRMVGAE